MWQKFRGFVFYGLSMLLLFLLWLWTHQEKLAAQEELRLCERAYARVRDEKHILMIACEQLRERSDTTSTTVVPLKRTYRIGANVITKNEWWRIQNDNCPTRPQLLIDSTGNLRAN